MATPRLAKTILPGADGGPLRLDIRTGQRPGEKRPAVVICHGFKGFKDYSFFPKVAERLAAAGFVAVTFNFSGSGVSDGEEFDEPDRFSHSRPSNDVKDLATVVEYAVSEGNGWLGLLGHSRGGGTVVLHAGSDARVKSLVTWAAIDDYVRMTPEAVAQWRRDGKTDVVNARTGLVLPLYTDTLDDLDAHGAALDILAAAARIEVPWLIVQGTADSAVGPEVAHRLAAASQSPRTEMFLVEGGDHGFGTRHPWPGSNPMFEAVLEKTVGHFAKSL